MDAATFNHEPVPTRRAGHSVTVPLISPQLRHCRACDNWFGAVVFVLAGVSPLQHRPIKKVINLGAGMNSSSTNAFSFLHSDIPSDRYCG